jgi:preprotein translocase subunit SecE
MFQLSRQVELPNHMILILVTLIVIGVVLWLVNTKIPMDSTFKTVINVIAVLAVCLWLLSAFGVVPASSLPQLRVR